MGLEDGSNPLLSSLICHSNPYKNAGDEDAPVAVADNDDNVIFEDDDGRLYQTRYCKSMQQTSWQPAFIPGSATTCMVATKFSLQCWSRT